MISREAHTPKNNNQSAQEIKLGQTKIKAHTYGQRENPNTQLQSHDGRNLKP
jgi:hypothetical protein